MKNNSALEFKDGKLSILDQTKLPLEEAVIETEDYERVALAIERLEVRGAPAIGIAAAYGIALAIKNAGSDRIEIFQKAFERLASTRPTAVNLFWALNEMKNNFETNRNSPGLYDILLEKAFSIHNDDIEKCDMIAKNGLAIFKRQSAVLTHCNTGFLATGGEGTALNVIKNAYVNRMVSHVYADETRPLLQGSRLTAYELSKNNIPFTLNTDSTAAFLMKQNKIDLVITGADRIALNGDSANKIGTYNLAVLCSYHGIPFYIAAPTSTIDKNCASGDDIKIELRDKSELTRFKNERVTLDEYPVYTPAFDVTPSGLISGIITEKDLHKPPFNFSDV